MNPFDYVNAINSAKKQDIIRESDDPTDAEKQYVPFVTNKALSYFADTLMYANAMNIHNHLQNKLQFDYLLNSVRPAKRMSKWVKVQDNDDVELIKLYFGYNTTKAKQVLSLLSLEQLSTLKKELSEGGVDDDQSRGSG